MLVRRLQFGFVENPASFARLRPVVLTQCGFENVPIDDGFLLISANAGYAVGECYEPRAFLTDTTLRTVARMGSTELAFHSWASDGWNPASLFIPVKAPFSDALVW